MMDEEMLFKKVQKFLLKDIQNVKIFFKNVSGN
jgi:hypothetical protein